MSFSGKDKELQQVAAAGEAFAVAEADKAAGIVEGDGKGDNDNEGNDGERAMHGEQFLQEGLVDQQAVGSEGDLHEHQEIAPTKPRWADIGDDGEGSNDGHLLGGRQEKVDELVVFTVRTQHYKFKLSTEVMKEKILEHCKAKVSGTAVLVGWQDDPTSAGRAKGRKKAKQEQADMEHKLRFSGECAHLAADQCEEMVMGILVGEIVIDRDYKSGGLTKLLTRGVC